MFIYKIELYKKILKITKDNIDIITKVTNNIQVPKPINTLTKILLVVSFTELLVTDMVSGITLFTWSVVIKPIQVIVSFIK